MSTAAPARRRYHHGTAPDYSLPYNPAAEPAVGTVGHKVEGNAEFNGWGYVRLFKTRISSRVGTPGSVSQIDTYAIPDGYCSRRTRTGFPAD